MTAPTGHRSMPVLGVADVREGLDFYHNKLGFRVGGMFSHDEPDLPIQFAILEFGAITLALQRDADAQTHPRHSLSAYFYIDGVDAYYEQVKAKTVDIAEPPHVTFYGIREFTVRDNFGYLLAFGEDLQPSSRGPGL